MFSLMKQAEWTDTELRAYMIKRFHKSHWNLLDQRERRAVIAMLQYYINKNATNNDINQKENPHGKETDDRTHQD